MKVRINGEMQEVRENITITELLEDLGIRSPFIAVAVNREIVPKTAYLTTTIQEGDTIEIVHPVQGG
ncbi:MAG: sulfur carrier protein ThiS [Nitrospinota bacterium]|nr:MAG: sulfur carrier protein ThiS [Nitrospinota bacterium]